MWKKIWAWLNENTLGTGIERTARLGFIEYQCKLIKAEREEKERRLSDKLETPGTKHLK